MPIHSCQHFNAYVLNCIFHCFAINTSSYTTYLQDCLVEKSPAQFREEMEVDARRSGALSKYCDPVMISTECFINVKI